MAEKGKIRTRIAGVLKKDSKILFIKHKKDNKEYWLLPGGGLEYGENFQECLKREFLEETGLNIEVNDMVFVSESIEPNLERHIVNICFLVTANTDTIKLGDEANLIELKFMDKSDIMESTIYPNTKNELLEVLDGKNMTIRYLGNRWE